VSRRRIAFDPTPESATASTALLRGVLPAANAAQLRDAVFAAQARYHDPDFLFSRILASSVARQMSRTAFSASSECRSTLDLIFRSFRG
jgi:hypothetical protein